MKLQNETEQQLWRDMILADYTIEAADRTILALRERTQDDEPTYRLKKPEDHDPVRWRTLFEDEGPVTGRLVVTDDDCYFRFVDRDDDQQEIEVEATWFELEVPETDLSSFGLPAHAAKVVSAAIEDHLEPETVTFFREFLANEAVRNPAAKSLVVKMLTRLASSPEKMLGLVAGIITMFHEQSGKSMADSFANIAEALADTAHIEDGDLKLPAGTPEMFKELLG